MNAMKNSLVFLALLCGAFLTACDPTRAKESLEAEAPDREDVFCEVSARDITGGSQAMMWALRSDGRYKYVELRAKPGDPDMLLVVRHTRPRPAKGEQP